MKKKISEFPWYLIYTPIMAVVLISWYLGVETGDSAMEIPEILEKILNWLGLNEHLITSLVIIAIAVIALIYIVVKWFSANIKLKNIEEVAQTAPENIKQYVDAQHGSINKAISDTHGDITQKISDSCEGINKNISDTREEIKGAIAEVRVGIGTLIGARSTAPVQQSQLLGDIHSLFAVHDKDQQTIAAQKETICSLKQHITDLQRQNVELQRQNAELQQQNVGLRNELDNLTPDHGPTLSL